MNIWLSERKSILSGLVYLLGLNPDINLKRKLFTDNFSPVLSETGAIFLNFWLHIDNTSCEFWKPATGHLAPGA